MSRLGRLIRRSVLAVASGDGGSGETVGEAPPGAIRLSQYWADSLPPEDADVLLPAGDYIWDMNLKFNSLFFEGNWYDDPAQPTLKVETAVSINGTGNWYIGSPTRRRSGIEIVTHEIMMMGAGKKRHYGTKPTNVRTRLSVTAQKNDVYGYARQDISDWKAGDWVALSVTEFGRTGKTYIQWQLTEDCVGTKFKFPSGGAPWRFWGQLQYVVDMPLGTATAPADGAVRLTPGTFTPPAAGWTNTNVIDESCFLVNCSRGIKQRPPSVVDQQGIHTMMMEDARYQEDGVETVNGGWGGVLAHYPRHSHMQGYVLDSNGAATGDLKPLMTDSYSRNCSYRDCFNRAAVFHGARGDEISDPVAVNCIGMNYFFEDGSEVFNKLIRPTSIGAVAIPADSPKLFRKFDARVAGVWRTNPLNDVIDAWVANSDNVGLWDSFALQCWGLSAKVKRLTVEPYDLNAAPSAAVVTANAGLMIPAFMGNVTGSTSGNILIGNWDRGIDRQLVQIALDGTTTPQNHEPWRDPINKALHDIGTNIFKSIVGYENRVFAQTSETAVTDGAQYDRWTVADCGYNGLVGSASGRAKNMLLCGSTQAATLLQFGLTPDPIPIATYHFDLVPQDSVFVNYPAKTPINNDPIALLQGGVGMMFWDIYLTPWDGGLARVTNMAFKNAGIGFRQPNRMIEGEMRSYFTNSRAYAADGSTDDNYVGAVLWDKLGLVGPAGWTWVFDRPFYTHGVSSGNIAQVQGIQNGVSVNRDFIGFFVNKTDYNSNPYAYQEAYTAQRFPDTGTSKTVVDQHVRIAFTAGAKSALSGFAAAVGGRYKWFSQGKAPAKQEINVAVYHHNSTSSVATVYWEWDGTVPAKVTQTRGPAFVALGSEAAVLASTVPAYWQDTANNLMVIQHVGSVPPGFDPNSTQSVVMNSSYNLAIKPL